LEEFGLMQTFQNWSPFEFSTTGRMIFLNHRLGKILA
jgi:hypothetical protein